MSGSGAPEVGVTASNARIAVIAASWHERVIDGLIAGAQRAAARSNARLELFRVPGSFELPIACQRAAAAGFDAVVALGVIVRGGTPHFEYVSAGVTQGLSQVALTAGIPVGFGVLTCDTEEQALDRAGLPGSSEDKGAEVVDAVLGTVATLRRIDGHQQSYPGFTPAGQE
ncbi:MAG: 6,7-dimethyl-8-ribityllumazine synthase [Candidatus Nanopelagicales bacterium]